MCIYIYSYILVQYVHVFHALRLDLPSTTQPASASARRPALARGQEEQRLREELRSSECERAELAKQIEQARGRDPRGTGGTLWDALGRWGGLWTPKSWICCKHYFFGGRHFFSASTLRVGCGWFAVLGFHFRVKKVAPNDDITLYLHRRGLEMQGGWGLGSGFWVRFKGLRGSEVRCRLLIRVYGSFWIGGGGPI